MSENPAGDWALQREASVSKVYKPWKPPEPEAKRQRVLLTGLDCLSGQQDLFATDGEPPN
jgi:hypothetical protein